MSSRKQLAVDTNIIMDAVKPDGAEDVDPDELCAARELGARLLTENVLVYSSKVEQEWTAKNLLRPDSILSTLARHDRLKKVKPLRLSRGQEQMLGQHVDLDDQPFVLVAAVIDDGTRILATRDPKTTIDSSRRYVKKNFSVLVKKATEFA